MPLDAAFRWQESEYAVGNACKYNGNFAARTGAVANPFGSLVIYRERNAADAFPTV